MRRPTMFALLLLTAGPALCAAQGLPVNAHATVTTSVSIVRLADLTFGAIAVLPGAPATVTPANGGKARIDYNEPAFVTAPSFVMLGGPAGSQLRVDLQCASHATATATAPVNFPSGCASGFTPPISGNVGGTHYLYVGGTLAAAATNVALAGSYTGSFSITASYVVY